jgi:peptidoglycan/LPS O-acetylase OafA/YrhL
MKIILEPKVSDLMDALRGGSALIVAFAHSFQIFCLPFFGLYGFPHLFTSWLATYAVVTFFIVSGFMICLSVSNHSDVNGFNVMKFFKARFLRIYPPLLASLLICVSIFLLMDGFEMHGSQSFRLGGELFVSREKIQIEWERFIPTLLLIYSIVPGSPPPLSINGPLWSLSYEWWFYLFAMFVSHAAANKTASLRYLPLMFFLALFWCAPAGQLLWIFLLIWCSGYLLAYLYKSEKLMERRYLFILLLSMVLCILGIFAVGHEKTLTYLAEPLQRYGNPGHKTMMFVGFIITIILGFMIRKKVHVQFLSGAARYSYTLYLIHFPIQLFAFGLLHRYLVDEHWRMSLIMGVVVTLLAVAMASQLAKVVENRELISYMIQRRKR